MSTPIPLPKSFSRLEPIPIDRDSLFATYADLTAYAVTRANAYPGLICSVTATNTPYIINSDKSVTSLLTLSGTTLQTVLNYLSTNSIIISSLLVSSNISAANIIYALSGNSNQWNQAFNVSTIYQNASGNWQNTFTAVQTNSGSWNKNYIYTTANTNLSSNYKYAFDTTSNILTATLPPNPQLGDEIELFDISGTWSVNNLIVENNTNYIEQRFDNLQCNVRYGLIKLIYTNSVGWRIIPQPRHDILPFLTPSVSIALDSLSGTTPFTVNLTGVNNLSPLIAPVDTWYWDLSGDSEIDNASQITSFTYTTSGVYTISLSGINSAGNSTAFVTVTAVGLLPTPPALSGDPYSEYVTLLLHFN
jgi:hypothetical protein